MVAVRLSRFLAGFSFPILCLGTACGGSAAAPRPPLPDGEAVYTLRLNPPPCLTGNPDLYFEVQTPLGWERVSLENPEEDQDLLGPFVAEAQTDPKAMHPVRARFRNETRAYGEHAARVLRLLSVKPDAPAE